MNENTISNVCKNEVVRFFSSDLAVIAKQEGWTKDSQWTDGIHKRMAEIGHECGFLVFATQSRCPAADGNEWLYDHHWRVVGDDGSLHRVPLAMEIEWGYGAATIYEKITEDFLKLAQARADLRVMVFHCNEVEPFTEKLIAMARSFEGSQQGDKWLFAGWDWDDNQMYCRLWSADSK